MTLRHLKLRLLCWLSRVCWHCGHVQECDPYSGWYCPNCDMCKANASLEERYRLARTVRKERGLK